MPGFFMIVSFPPLMDSAFGALRSTLFGLSPPVTEAVPQLLFLVELLLLEREDYFPVLFHIHNGPAFGTRFIQAFI